MEREPAQSIHNLSSDMAESCDVSNKAYGREQDGKTQSEHPTIHSRQETTQSTGT